MSTSFIKGLNLRPQEKRLMVVIAVVVFLVVNFVGVRPYFKDLGPVQDQMAAANKSVAEHLEKIGKDTEPKNGYQAQLKAIEKNQGGIITSSSAIQLQTTIMTQSAATGVTVSSYSQVNTASVGPGGSNDFFEVQSININLDSPEKELVDFLVNIGGDSSMIRVRGMNLHPADANRYRLKGELTLNASYRKSPAQPVPQAAPRPIPANARKPAMMPGTKKTDKQ